MQLEHVNNRMKLLGKIDNEDGFLDHPAIKQVHCALFDFYY